MTNKKRALELIEDNYQTEDMGDAVSTDIAYEAIEIASKPDDIPDIHIRWNIKDDQGYFGDEWDNWQHLEEDERFEYFKKLFTHFYKLEQEKTNWFNPSKGEFPEEGLKIMSNNGEIYIYYGEQHYLMSLNKDYSKLKIKQLKAWTYLPTYKED